MLGERTNASDRKERNEIMFFFARIQIVLISESVKQGERSRLDASPSRLDASPTRCLDLSALDYEWIGRVDNIRNIRDIHDIRYIHDICFFHDGNQHVIETTSRAAATTDEEEEEEFEEEEGEEEGEEKEEEGEEEKKTVCQQQEQKQQQQQQQKQKQQKQHQQFLVGPKLRFSFANGCKSFWITYVGQIPSLASELEYPRMTGRQ